jgi:glycosyl hydrolase family 64 (putative beta-1,3-glucanase)
MGRRARAAWVAGCVVGAGCSSAHPGANGALSDGSAVLLDASAGALGEGGQPGLAAGGSGGLADSAADLGTGLPLPTSDASASDGGAPAGFWDSSNIPSAKNVMMFRFLNRTNGKFADSEVYWSFKNGANVEVHSIADQPDYDMPANASGRVYFYLCGASDATCTGDPTKSKYFDFIEHTIGAHQYNGNTTRVDAFGIKLAIRLHCSDGYDVAVGEDYPTFQEDRAVTFQKFIDSVPTEFKSLAQPPNAPYRIVQPGAGSFGPGGANANYYNSFVDALWASNGLTIAKPGPNASGLAAYPDVSAAIYRHVGTAPGTFDAAGKLLDQKLWADKSAFYSATPADYYAWFWHAHALNGKAYGFPYDDVGGYSSYISHTNPQYLLVAIGW